MAVAVRSRSLAFGALGALFALQSLHAAETANVLPQGISRFRIVGVSTGDISEKFNSSGLLEPYTRSLNRSVTIQDYMAKEPRLGQLVDALNNLEAGLGNQLLNTNLYSDFSVQAQQLLLAYEYGINSRLSLGIRAPMVKRTATLSFKATTVNNAAYIAEQIGKLSPEMSAGIYNVGAQTFDTAFFQQALFGSKGYEAPTSFQKSEIGDTEIGGKYKFIADGPLTVSAQSGVRLPTGSGPSLTNIFDTGSGGGAFGVAAQFFQEYKANPFLTLGAMQKVSHYFPDTRKRAVPKDENDSLPSLLPQDGQVREVKRTQGLQLDSEVSSTVGIPGSGVSAWSALQFSAQGAARFSGDGDLHYAGLSKGTEFRKTALEFGLGYSTIPLFMKKKFKLPLDVEALYNVTLNGKNVALASYGRMDLKFYF